MKKLFKGTSKNSDFFLSSRKHRADDCKDAGGSATHDAKAENRSHRALWVLQGVNEDLSTELTLTTSWMKEVGRRRKPKSRSGKKCIFRGALKLQFLKKTALYLLSLTVMACGPGTISNLKDIKNLHQGGEYQEVAATEVNCKASDEGCNQVHLLVGDACFRLAKQDVSVDGRKKYYSCAVSNLFAGVDMTKDWSEVDVRRGQVYENALESARLRADFGERSKYEAILNSYAKAYIQLSPASPGANYYMDRASFYSTRLQGNDCGSWQFLLSRVKQHSQSFQANTQYRGSFSTLLGLVRAEVQVSCQ